MTNNKQSSVDWLKSIVKSMIENGGDADLHAVLWHIEQAKAMHKDEIVKAFIYGDASDCLDEDDSIPYAEEYYNNTFQ